MKHKTEQGPPYFREPSYIAYSGGKAYKVAQNGDVLVARERGVAMGDMRMFFYFSNTENQSIYYAERQFKSIFHPLRAPKIWWRKAE